MRRRLVLLAPLALAACSSDGEPDEGVGRKLEPSKDKAVGGMPDRLPDVELAWLKGKKRVRLRDVADEPTVFNIWAQWCGPCRSEMPHFQRLNARNVVQVVGIDYLDDPVRAGQFIEDLELTYPQLADPKGLLKAPFRLGAGIPVTVFTTAGGGIRHVERRPYRSADTLFADVRKHLKVSL